MALQFLPEPEQDEKNVRELAAQFTNAVIRPSAMNDDQSCRFRRDEFQIAAAQGFASLLIPKEYRGQAMSSRAYYGAIEEISRGSAAMAITLGVTGLVQGALLAFGNDSQKAQYLPRLACGEWLGAFSLSEPGSGSDAAALRTSAKRVEGGYRIQGNKMWCSNGGDADLYLLMARTHEHKTKGISAFLIKKDTPGFRIGKQEKKMGLRASSLAELIFEDCFVAEEDRLGNEGDGLAVALSQLDAGRITIGVVGVGLALEAIERAWQYHDEHPNAISEAVRLNLAGYFAELAAVKALVTSAARAKDSLKTITTLASQVKLLGSDLAMKVTSEVVEAMGETGYRTDAEVERLMRDAKALQIVEGTNQIQKLVLTRQMGEMFSSKRNRT